MRLLGASDMKLRNPTPYGTFALSPIDPADARQISVDVNRTLTTNVIFTSERIGQAALRRLLTAWCAIAPQTGYTQGMGFYAAMFLLHMSEEDAFWAFVALMRNREVRGLFTPGMPLLRVLTRQYEACLARRYPAVAGALEACGLEAALYLPQWFLKGFRRAGAGGSGSVVRLVP